MPLPRSLRQFTVLLLLAGVGLSGGLAYLRTTEGDIRATNGQFQSTASAIVLDAAGDRQALRKAGGGGQFGAESQRKNAPNMSDV